MAACRDGVCCSAALAMLSCRSPANADVLRPTIANHAMMMRTVLIWLPPDLRAKLQPARQNISSRHAERRRRSELGADILEGVAVGHVQGVEEHAERRVRLRGQPEILLRAEIDEVDI